MTRVEANWVATMQQLSLEDMLAHELTVRLFGMDWPFLRDVAHKVANKQPDNLALATLQTYNNVYRALAGFLGYSSPDDSLMKGIRSEVAHLRKVTNYGTSHIFRRLDYGNNPGPYRSHPDFDAAEWDRELETIRSAIKQSTKLRPFS